MQGHLAQRSLAASHRELDAKLELLQQLGYEDRFYDDADDHPLSEKSGYLDRDTARWIQTEYDWALGEATDSTVSIPDLFDVEEEDEEACLPCVYDPTFFAARPSAPSTPRTRSQSLTQPFQSDFDKPLPSIPPLRLRPRPSLPLVPPPTPTSRSQFSSPIPSAPVSPRSPLSERRQSPPPSPRLASRLSSSPKPRPFPRSQASSTSISTSPPARPSAHRHATYPSISSTMSLLEERETEAEKRAAVYVAEEVSAAAPAPRLAGRGRSSSAAVLRTNDDEFGGPFPISSSPRRKQRPILPALTTSHSTPQLRNLAELATMPSPSFTPASTLLPSPMSDATVTPDTEVVTPGEAITCSPLDSPAGETEAALASRWSLDSVASRPRIRQASPDVSSSPASKTKKRDRLLSLISGRSRSGSVGKTTPPLNNTPRVSSDVLDIRRSDSRETTHSPSRPSFSMTALPPRTLAPSLSSSSSSNGSSASTLATPVEPAQPTPLPDMDPFAANAASCVPEEELVFAANPDFQPESPLFAPEKPSTSPSPPPRESLSLQIPSRPATPCSPPPEPTLPLPSPSTPSPSFLVPTPRSQSFFASLTGRQRRRKKKLVISGAPLEKAQPRASSSVSTLQTNDDVRHREVERQRRVDNVIKWCESFGPTRRVEHKEDGSLHVYWKDWEVADMVCRVQAQVVIKDVGRVNLAWSYIS